MRTCRFFRILMQYGLLDGYVFLRFSMETKSRNGWQSCHAICSANRFGMSVYMVLLYVFVPLLFLWN